MTSVVDTSVKFFHSQQPGAPVLAGQVGSLIALLDACLVNGFGAKSVVSLTVASGVATITVSGTHSAVPYSVILIAGSSIAALNGEQKVTAITDTTIKFATGASDGTATGTMTVKQAGLGWDKPFSGTNLAVYRPSDITSGRRFLRVNDTNAINTRVLGYENMTTVSAGTGLFPTSAQVSGGFYWTKSYKAGAAPNTWTVMGNSKVMYIMVADGASTYSNPGIGKYLFGFGDFLPFSTTDNYAQFSSGAVDASRHTVLASSNLSPASRYLYVPRISKGTGTSIAAGVVTDSSGMAGDGSRGPYPSPVDGSLQLEYASIYAGVASAELDVAGVRGRLPGFLRCSQTLPPLETVSFSDLDIIDGSTPGSKLMAVGVSEYYYENTTGRAGVFFDIIGPWG